MVASEGVSSRRATSGAAQSIKDQLDQVIANDNKTNRLLRSLEGIGQKLL